MRPFELKFYVNKNENYVSGEDVGRCCAFCRHCRFWLRDSEPLQDYVADRFYNDGRTAMMDAEARATYKDLHAHAMTATGSHVASVAKMAIK